MDMGGMDMGSMPADACKISMLLNWYSVGACIISEDWHIRTHAQFAGTVIGIFLMAFCIEGVRRLGREYDRRLVAAHVAQTVSIAPVDSARTSSSEQLGKGDSASTTRTTASDKFKPGWKDQAVRGLVFGVQFTGAYFLMLVGMYFNIALLIAIFVGATTGYVCFARDTVDSNDGLSKADSGCCC